MKNAAASIVTKAPRSNVVEVRVPMRTSERQRAKWQAAACVAGER